MLLDAFYWFTKVMQVRVDQFCLEQQEQVYRLPEYLAYVRAEEAVLIDGVDGMDKRMHESCVAYAQLELAILKLWIANQNTDDMAIHNASWIGVMDAPYQE